MKSIGLTFLFVISLLYHANTQTTLVTSFNENYIFTLRDLVSDGNGFFYFLVKKDSPRTIELWQSKGTEESTILLKVLEAKNDADLIAGENGLIFISLDNDGDQLWSFNSLTNEFQKLWDDIYCTYQSDDYLFHNGFLYFKSNAIVENARYRVFKTDGTTINTTLIPESNAGIGIYAWNDLLVFSNPSFLEVYNPNSGVLSKVINQSDNDSPGAIFFSTVNNELLFFSSKKNNQNIDETYLTTILADTGNTYYTNALHKVEGFEPMFYEDYGFTSELLFWQRQGTLYTYNTQSNEIKTVKELIDIRYFYTYNDEVYFRRSTVEGSHLWKSDGTAVGTVKVNEDGVYNGFSCDLYYGGTIPYFEPFKNRLFYIGHDEQYTAMRQLRSTDGTPGLTQKEDDINGTYYDMIAFENELFLIGKFDNQYQLRKYTGIGNSIKNSKITNKLILSPNPAQNYISVNKSGNIEIYNTMGQKCYTNTIEFHQSINIEGLVKGVYTIVLKNNNNTQTAKFIKQ